MSNLKKGHTIEERLELSMLYDFYGALLKENQRRMFEANVLEDYNFSEIAEEEGITRQGAYDTVKRAAKQLKLYEEKLGLVARFREQKELISRLRDRLQEMDIAVNNNGWAEIFQLLEEVLEG
ncbi:MAG: DNA-binding protein [Lachnospiraceae bacterium]